MRFLGVLALLGCCYPTGGQFASLEPYTRNLSALHDFILSMDTTSPHMPDEASPLPTQQNSFASTPTIKDSTTTPSVYQTNTDTDDTDYSTEEAHQHTDLLVHTVSGHLSTDRSPATTSLAPDFETDILDPETDISEQPATTDVDTFSAESDEVTSMTQSHSIHESPMTEETNDPSTKGSTTTKLPSSTNDNLGISVSASTSSPTNDPIDPSTRSYQETSRDETSKTTLFSEFKTSAQSDLTDEGDEPSESTISKSSSDVTAGVTLRKMTAAMSTANLVSLSSQSTETPSPVILNPLPPIITKLGTPASFQIPSDTFYDRTDGMTPFLDLSVQQLDHSPVSPSFWLSFDAADQIIHAFPLPSDDLRDSETFFLTAQNSRGLQISHQFTVQIDDSSQSDVSHEFEAVFSIRHQNILISRLYFIDLFTLLAQYFGDINADRISVTNVKNGSVILKWTNTTISKGHCENNTLAHLYGLISSGDYVNPAFRKTMEPLYPVNSVNFHYRGICSEFDDPLPSTDGTDDSYITLIAVLVPLLIIAVLILLCLCYLFGCCNFDSQKGKYLPEDQVIYMHRSPVILDNENDKESVKPYNYPVIIPADLKPSTYDNPAYETDSVGYGSSTSEPPKYTSPSSSPDLDVNVSPMNVAPPPDYKIPPTYLSPVSTSSA